MKTGVYALLLLGTSYMLGGCFNHAHARNFVATGASPDFCRQVEQFAEQYRRDLAVLWLGEPLPGDWASPCPINLQVSPDLGAGGATSFSFEGGQVGGWNMTIQGSPERILDSVLPHEVNHTIFASHFRQPIPRWADEGACTTVEHASEKRKQHAILVECLQTKRGIPFAAMFAMREYPADVLPLYSQGHSLCKFLLHHQDRPAFVAFIGDGLQSKNWTSAVDGRYGYASLEELQRAWLAWFSAGSPAPDKSQIQTVGYQLHTVNAPRMRWNGRSWEACESCSQVPQQRDPTGPLVDVQVRPRQPAASNVVSSSCQCGANCQCKPGAGCGCTRCIDHSSSPPPDPQPPAATTPAVTTPSKPPAKVVATPDVLLIESRLVERIKCLESKLENPIVGPAGPAGPAGTPGPPGEKGADGSPGKDGNHGNDGKSVDPSELKSIVEHAASRAVARAFTEIKVSNNTVSTRTLLNAGGALISVVGVAFGATKLFKQK